MRLAAALLTPLLVACATGGGASSPLGVGELMERGHELDGLNVRVVGVMGICGLQGCEMRDAGARSETVFVGGDADFARSARLHAGRLVVVQARFDASCLHGSAPPPPGTGIVACVGRGTPLRNARLVEVR